MSSLNMDVDLHVDVLDLMAEEDFNFEETIFSWNCRSLAMLPTCALLQIATFKGLSHRERSCPHQGCKALVRRKSDMKSHLRYIHPTIIESTISKATSQMVRATLDFCGTTSAVPRLPRQPGFLPWQQNLDSPRWRILLPGLWRFLPGDFAVFFSSSLELSTSSLEQSSSSMEPSSFLVEPSSLMVEPLLPTTAET